MTNTHMKCTYTVHRLLGPFSVEGIQILGEPVTIPKAIRKACWLDRLLNRWVKVYRSNGTSEELIFNWPSRRLNVTD